MLKGQAQVVAVACLLFVSSCGGTDDIHSTPMSHSGVKATVANTAACTLLDLDMVREIDPTAVLIPRVEDGVQSKGSCNYSGDILGTLQLTVSEADAEFRDAIDAVANDSSEAEPVQILDTGDGGVFFTSDDQTATALWAHGDVALGVQYISETMTGPDLIDLAEAVDDNF